MFFKNLDILSSHITLYHKGFLYHSTVASIILSIISFIIIGFFTIIQLIIYIVHIEKPTLTFNNIFLEKAGFIKFNPSSLFHYININRENTDNNTYDEIEFDFEKFRIIGFETYLEEYINNKNINNFNHWLYGPCDNISDFSYMKDLINSENLQKYACLKKYYDLKEQKYINITELNFRWPIIENDKTTKFYSIIIEKCEENTLKEIFNDNKKCKNNLENENIQKYGNINFNFLDKQIDNENLFVPIKTHINKIENKLSNDSYCINNIYFNRLALFTNYNTFLKKNITFNYTHIFDRNDLYVLKKNKEEKNIFVGYYIWLNKRCNYYYREYMTLTKAISNIGGISNVIISIFIFINKIFNKYGILSNSKDLYYTFSKIIKNKKEIKIKKSKFNTFDLEKSSYSNIRGEKNSNMTKNINLESKNNILENNKKNSHENINNFTYIEEKNFKNQYSNIIENNHNTNNNKLEDKNEKLNFFIYLFYKCSCGKAYKHIKLYEDLEMKIVSVENLFQNYLNMNNLIKINNDKG